MLESLHGLNVTPCVFRVHRKMLHDNSDHGEVRVVRGMEGHDRPETGRRIPRLQNAVCEEPFQLGLHAVPKDQRQGRCGNSLKTKLCCLCMNNLKHLIDSNKIYSLAVRDLFVFDYELKHIFGFPPAGFPGCGDSADQHALPGCPTWSHVLCRA